MEEFIPAIQEQLRRTDYPKFNREETEELILGPGTQPKVRSSTRWIFLNKENTAAVVLAQNFIALQVSQYTSFEIFLGALKAVLEIIGKVADISLTERLGLRYVNLIRPKKASISDYLQPGLLGLPAGELGIKRLQYRFESAGMTEAGKLVTRLSLSLNGKYLPPDLDGSGLDYKVTLEKDEPIILLDNDHFSVKQRDYNPAEIIAEMEDLHEYTDRAFRAAVTEQALSVWGHAPEEVLR
ncbi:MAG: hypothetical protein A3J70_12830 [Elusimicrobia bacterium RIFCSPHIGHO2_02_FULL_61_10]|nr:MAG: hypothetical protein A3J70_12830 [Elusimicrobia bacterium RIFCSPHIGHO2_02_FULL_61_10]